ncbi:glycosyltransferase family 2 protein [Puniceicoccaceae bacterium K14]|nr:glycosyltransferase family 2 protein [Puniceicoccaceae bacterium K14]
MNKLPITVVIAAKNEEANMPKCLASLKPAEKVILADSGSSDRTAEIADSFGAEVVQFNYAGGYPKKRQWILNTISIETSWVFMVDADEEIPRELWLEIEREILSTNPAVGYMINKGFHFMGNKFKFGGFSHPAVLLWRSGQGTFEETLATEANQQDMEVHERVVISGEIRSLKHHLVHNDFKGLHAYYDRHNKYSTWEAALRYQFIENGHWGKSKVKAKLFGNSQEFRRFLKKFIIALPFEPWVWFVYHYLIQLGFLEGQRGLIASQIRREYIRQVRSKVFELQCK